jgi:hypothetical protein
VSTTVCLAPRSCITYPDGGGYLWIFLNWALGLRALGCRVIWLERVRAGTAPDEARVQVVALRERLEPYGLADALALFPESADDDLLSLADLAASLEVALEADVLLNFLYSMPARVVAGFRRSVLVDIDPGLLQEWLARGLVEVAEHDVRVTVGERVGGTWLHVPPPVALDHWPAAPRPDDGSFTTIAHWHAGGWTGADEAAEDKRSGFVPYLGLPVRGRRLELALDLDPADREAAALRRSGWRVVSAWEVAGTPWAYQEYIRRSLGEFSCAKPAYTRLGNAWISDRTICYLASGRPAVVEHTGPSAFLPDRDGLFRVRTPEEAARALDEIGADYERQSACARALAEEHFDARRAAARVLELAL